MSNQIVKCSFGIPSAVICTHTVKRQMRGPKPSGPDTSDINLTNHSVTIRRIGHEGISSQLIGNS